MKYMFIKTHDFDWLSYSQAVGLNPLKYHREKSLSRANGGMVWGNLHSSIKWFAYIIFEKKCEGGVGSLHFYGVKSLLFSPSEMHEVFTKGVLQPDLYLFFFFLRQDFQYKITHTSHIFPKIQNPSLAPSLYWSFLYNKSNQFQIQVNSKTVDGTSARTQPNRYIITMIYNTFLNFSLSNSLHIMSTI